MICSRYQAISRNVLTAISNVHFPDLRSYGCSR
uniref:Uncharacterized protein n=1 Tax=Anguilla anguilla TaxID=7936 RepID=A0A0E9QG67_ANGAN